ncbi:hypothetical protein BOTBODRAFT_28502 [Botryobasidium botryosum FD-172 SS1]|uniref:Plus3 domain-containing protein n=1 Tax=Botryobasidium botryosum (strain FD-172 SS1) TaxID=930990 RepID=A0A067MTE0_BOTB1|nr:hypothetical protein BOTBODRAFT_28502 [Botryobasidium botryosum FD-172 SS1]
MTSDDDLSDELLALAGQDNKPRKKRQASASKPGASKRRKQEAIADSDDEEPESEEDESNPYPLEGKYKDEYDRQTLLELPEIEREGILSTRLEERQRLMDKLNLDRLIKSTQSQNAESVSKAAKRNHTATGQTNEKKKGLAALAESRRERLTNRTTTRDDEDSPSKRRSSTPSGESTDEEGQVNKVEEDDAEDPSKKQDITSCADLEKIRLTRDTLAKFCMAPWFEDLVKEAWVRYLVGNNEGQPVYRICEVLNIGPDLVRPYKVNDQTVNQTLDLRHGTAQKCWQMDKVSNSPFTEREFARLVHACSEAKHKLPSKSKVEKKHAQITKLANQPLTESDISAIITRKNQLQQNKPNLSQLISEKSRLHQARALAAGRQEFDEVANINAQIQELEASHPELSGDRDKEEDRFARVNERNRKANIEAMRIASEVEKKRRKMLGAGDSAASSRDRTPTVDLSARVKTMPRLRHEASRPDTPVGGTPASKPPKPTEVVSAFATVPSAKTGIDLVATSMEIDLGDF